MRRKPYNLLFGSLVVALLLGACQRENVDGKESSSFTPPPPATNPGCAQCDAGGTSSAGDDGHSDEVTAPRCTADCSDSDDVSPETEPPGVQLIGRFDRRDSRGPQCAWPGCRIVARFTGTKVVVRLNEIDLSWMLGAPSEWDVTIDGVLGPKVVMTPGTRDYVLVEDLPPGEHLVELYKRTEAQLGTTQFLGFDFGDGSRVLSPPRRRARRIEIIGDSSAAGFGIEGVGLGPDCPGFDYAAIWENFHKSVGARLGEGLGAEVHGTVYSGKGIAKNIYHPDKETMPMLFARAAPVDPSSTWDFSYVPSVVVIMMGGNDFAIGQPYDEGPATLTEFTDAYDRFVVAIREHYPVAHVFLVTSPSVDDENPPDHHTRTNVLTGIAEVVRRRTAAGDAKVYSFVPVVASPAELMGCNGHGTPAFHQRLAAELAVAIRTKTGWQIEQQ